MNYRYYYSSLSGLISSFFEFRRVFSLRLLLHSGFVFVVCVRCNVSVSSIVWPTTVYCVNYRMHNKHLKSTPSHSYSNSKKVTKNRKQCITLITRIYYARKLPLRIVEEKDVIVIAWKTRIENGRHNQGQTNGKRRRNMSYAGRSLLQLWRRSRIFLLR